MSPVTMKLAKVRLKQLKGSGYICPVCKEGTLMKIKREKDLGDVNIKFRTRDGIGFKFSCVTKNDNFFLCKNEKCRARFERTEFKKGEKKVGPPCPIIKCLGSLDTYKNVPIAKIHPKKGEETVAITYGTSEPLKFKIISGTLSYDEAGICTECRYVGAKEINLR
jgi:hypothetical protein